jgi:hypothetical protein
VHGEVADSIRTGGDASRLPLLDDDRLAGFEKPVFVVNRDCGRPGEHHEQDIAFLIDVLGWPGPGRPSQQGRVQIFRRGAPERSA